MMLRRWRSLWIHCQRKRIMNRNWPRKPIPIHTISRGPSVFRYVAAASSRLCISRDPQHIAAAAVGLTGGRYRIQGQFEPLAARVIDAPDMVEFPRNEVSSVQQRQECAPFLGAHQSEAACWITAQVLSYAFDVGQLRPGAEHKHKAGLYV